MRRQFRHSPPARIEMSRNAAKQCPLTLWTRSRSKTGIRTNCSRTKSSNHRASALAYTWVRAPSDGAALDALTQVSAGTAKWPSCIRYSAGLRRTFSEERGLVTRVTGLAASIRPSTKPERTFTALACRPAPKRRRGRRGAGPWPVRREWLPSADRRGSRPRPPGSSSRSS